MFIFKRAKSPYREGNGLYSPVEMAGVYMYGQLSDYIRAGNSAKISAHFLQENFVCSLIP